MSYVSSNTKAAAKINGDAALQIYRGFHFLSESFDTLSKRFGVTVSTVRTICSRRSWKEETLPLARQLLKMGKNPSSLSRRQTSE